MLSQDRDQERKNPEAPKQLILGGMGELSQR
jgi:hypothetical protein